jgi:SAM-dependent methyltransferase
MIPDLYKEHAALEEGHWWFQGRRVIIRAALERAIPVPVERSLDVGCGTGINALLLRDFSRRVEAVETSEAAAAMARARVPDLQVNMVSFPDPSLVGPYGLVTLFDVLEHLVDDGAALASVEALLSPGGTALLTVPALPALWSVHDEAAHHQRRYTHAGLTRLIASSTSLELVKMSYFNTLLLPPIYILRQARKLLGLGGGGSDFFALPAPLNLLLASLLASEAAWIRHRDLPLGVSLLCQLRKRA